MKIQQLKINGFGKLKEQEIELTDGINIIYGKNEAGKSTLLKFISSMFYGISKNKNGGTVPEIEKYKPWHTESFSGKIHYVMDNGKSYELFRDFRKKNPQIFDEGLIDISKEFTIDKTKGNLFFEDQTGIEEDVFSSSIITKQAEVKIDEKTRNMLIQKISNILGTGEDTTSYTTVMNQLKKKLNDEVGTPNTKEKPINVVESKLEKLIKEKEELEAYQKHQFDVSQEMKEKTEFIQKKQEEIELLRRACLQKEKLKEDENKIQTMQELIQNFENDMQVLQTEIKNITPRKESKIFTAKWILVIFLFVCSIGSIVFVKCDIAKWMLPAVFALITILITKQQIAERKVKQKWLEQKKEREQKMQILKENITRQQEELDKIQEKYIRQLEEICKEYAVQNLDTILEQINQTQKEVNEQNMALYTLTIKHNQNLEKLERLIHIEEELEDLKEQKKELELKRESIKRTMDALEIAYHQMKEHITPKFTQELSKTMEQIAHGKYKSVNINTNGELMVEQASGEYISAENLSIGTVDQLYLALRLATIKEITKENMPIILDEAFAYYDNERLENILKYLANEYAQKQIILFTCTNREENILECLHMDYHKIEL